MPSPESSILRPAGHADSAALALIGCATFLETFAGILEGENILEHCARKHSSDYYRAHLAEARSAAWLAEVKGAPVGYALVTTPADLPIPLAPSDLELRRIYLLSRFHGSGIGRRLMLAALGHARAQSAARLLLGVYGQNTRAIAFYRHMGFVEAGTRTYRVGQQVCQDLVLSAALD